MKFPGRSELANFQDVAYGGGYEFPVFRDVERRSPSPFAVSPLVNADARGFPQMRAAENSSGGPLRKLPDGW